MRSSIWIWIAIVGVLSLLATLLLLSSSAAAAPAAGSAALTVDPSVLRWAYAAAAAATAVSSAAAAYAVARVASASVGALTEKPELFGRVLVLVGLAEGIAIYGLIISILILNHLG
jgi:V/A-type H+-transporting ATPase subunit K